jgi:hypothetical protein
MLAHPWFMARQSMPVMSHRLMLQKLHQVCRPHLMDFPQSQNMKG